MKNRDEHANPEDRAFSANAAPLEHVLLGRNNGFDGLRNINDGRRMTTGELYHRRLRPRGATADGTPKPPDGR